MSRRVVSLELRPSKSVFPTVQPTSVIGDHRAKCIAECISGVFLTGVVRLLGIRPINIQRHGVSKEVCLILARLGFCLTKSIVRIGLRRTNVADWPIERPTLTRRSIGDVR